MATKKIQIKPFFAYAGGKSTMAKYILPLIPPHICYVEPFFGSGVIFWKKDQAKVSVINDLNHEVVNFWRVVGTKLDELIAELKLTLYSRYEFERATKIRRECKQYNELQRAWAFFVSQNQCFGGKDTESWGIGKDDRGISNYENKIENIEQLKDLIKDKLDGCEYSDLEQAWAFFVSQNQSFGANPSQNNWGYSKDVKPGRKTGPLIGKYENTIENIEEFIDIIKTRVKKTFIECRPATKVIKQFDGADTFHFLDPPYINTEQTQYKGNEYNKDDMIELLELCATLQGKFMLTHYDNELIREHAEKNKWTVKEVTRTSSVANAKAGAKARPKKTELIVMNYNNELF